MSQSSEEPHFGSDPDPKEGSNMGMWSGAGLCTLALPTTLFLVGLSPVGPVAGGMFAAAQAAGSVTAGSLWAVGQSIAMGGSVGTAAGVTATSSAICGFLGH